MANRPQVAVLLASLAALPVAADEISPAVCGPRKVRFTYEATLTPPEGAGVVELWMPLPRDEDQTVTDVRFSGSAEPTIFALDPSGDRVAYIRVERPTGAVTLSETGTVARQEVEVVHATAMGDAAVDRVAFAATLEPSTSVVINDEIRTIAHDATADKTGTVARARALYDWVFDHMQYDKSVSGGGLGDVPHSLKAGKGDCTDFHTLFIALARANGIPARWNIGFPLAYGDGATEQAVDGYHCWAEFYASGPGWIPVDISEARQHPELKDYFFGHLSGNRILMSRARDLVLAPDPTATRRNYLVYPVARVDGKDASEVQWTFRYRDLAGG